ncbi:hypothetical protein BDK61_4296 [Haloarcula quadrata]|jgi:hypothetical protein|uniref:Uncharacterized protein n=3 Tax=Haloarcula TaxID=2237 RepID=Q5V7K0_HALMA|nr:MULTISPECIES: hypothetical protein [Haloarcula]AAV44469.1 unknown [Haloarcula marismortui ATCC 43049]QCP89669.1 hypothetical protein E6P14_01890 [Haloarcula marismortui ATCC 43049]QUJ74813.1 hypothetical protein KDQ40_22105 [Haloarcula sinaiiensis ATCC 33800]RKS75780.1 hypothetical protein BDK61_4296 [Haloarcula quadrata]
MNRRTYLSAVAAALGVTATSGAVTADDDNDRYESVTQEFADVTQFAAPDATGTADNYVRLYDDTTETLIYGTIQGTDHVAIATRDASEIDFTP